MATEITINGTLTLDQTSGPQDDDDAIGNNMAGDPSLTNLSAAFITFLGDTSLGSLNVNVLSATQKDFADDVEAVISGANFVTVSQNDAEINDLFFSDADGNPLDGDQVFLDPGTNSMPLQTVDGDNVYLWSFGDFVLATTSNDPTAKGDVVAAFYLNEAGDHLSASIEYVSFIPLAHPDDTDPDDTVDFTDILKVAASATLSFEFDPLESGKFLWVAVGDSDNGLLVTGKDLNVQDPGTSNEGKRVSGGPDPSDAVNTSQGGTGATIGINNQLWVPGNEGIFTFVRGFDPLGAGPDATGDNVTEIDYDGYINTVGAGLFISQKQGSPASKLDMTITVFQAGGGTTPEEGFDYIGAENGNDGSSGAFDDDDPVPVETVTVIGADGVTEIGTWNVGDGTNGTTQGSVTILITGNEIEVDDVDALYTIKWTVFDGTTFNRFGLVADDGKFDVGRVDIDEGIIITEPVGDKLLVDDDGPTAALATTEAVVTLDETDNDGDDPGVGGSLADVTTPIATLFDDTSAFGTDGGKDADDDGTVDADATTYSLVLNGADGTASGLTDTLSGNSINLYKVSDTEIEGRVDTDDNGSDETVAFEIFVTNDPDNVRVVQWRAVVHDDFPDDPDESDDPEMMNANLVLLRTTVIDDDGDTDSDDAELGARIKFEDDGPSIVRNTEAVPQLTTDDTDTPNDTDSASFAGLFTTVFGSDGFKDADDNNVQDADAITYALGVKSPGVFSGVFDSLTGNGIFLYLESGVVVGRVGTDAVTANPAGAIAFSVSVDSLTGVVTLEQDRAVVHDDPTDPAEDGAGEPTTLAAADLITLTATATDGDLDEDAATADIGDAFNFLDDGPTIDIALSGNSLDIDLDESIVTPASTSDESGTIEAGADDTLLTAPDGTNAFGRVTTASGAVAALFSDVTVDAGKDGDDRTDSYKLSLTDAGGNPVTGAPVFDSGNVGFNGVETTMSVSADVAAGGVGVIYLFLISDTVIEGRVDLDGDGILGDVALRFTLDLTTPSDPLLTTEQILAIAHDTITDHDEAETLGIADQGSGVAATAGLGIVKTSTLADNDLDEAEDSATYNFTGDVVIEDDGPIVNVEAASTAEKLDALHRNLDETINPDGNEMPDGADTYASGEPESDGGPSNGDLDDVIVGGAANLPVWETDPDGFADASSEAIGKLETTIGQVAALFDATAVDFGTDGAGDLGGGSGRTDTLSFVLAAPVETTVVATAVDGSPLEGLSVAQRTVWLVKVSDTVIEGRVPGLDGMLGTGDDDYVILRITLTNPTDPANATLVYEQFAPVVHPDGTLYDEAVDLLTTSAEDTLAIRWTAEAEDKDGDTDSDFADVTIIDNVKTVVSIDDDGPGANATDPLPLEEDDLDNETVDMGAIVAGSEGLNEDGSVGAHTRVDDLSVAITGSIDADTIFAITTDDDDLDDLAAALNLKSKGDAVAFDAEQTAGTGTPDDPTDDTYVLTAYVEDGTNPGEFNAGEDRKVFTWTVTAAGLATLELFDQLDHAIAAERIEPSGGAADDNDQEESLTFFLTGALRAFDKDGDLVELPEDFIGYAVEDDMPDIGDGGANVGDGSEDVIPNAVIDFAEPGTADETSSKTVNLEAVIGTDENVGGGGVTITSFEPEILYGSQPDPDLRLLAQISADLKTVEYIEDENNNGMLDAGETTVFFRLSIDDTDADSSNWTYTWEALEPPPPALLEFVFAGFPSGNQIYGVFGPANGAVNPDGTALLVMPEGLVLKNDGKLDSSASETLNSSKSDGSTTALAISNNSIDSGEAMFFVSIHDPEPNSIVVGDATFDSTSYKDADTLGFSGTDEFTSASMEIAQTTPNGSLVDIRITAFDIDPGVVGDGTSGEENNDFLQNPTGTDTQVNIDSVSVIDGTGDVIEFWQDFDHDGTYELGDGDGDGLVDKDGTVDVDFTDAGGGIFSATVLNAGDDFTIRWTTEDPADMWKIENVDDGKDGLDIGGFNLEEAQPLPDQALDWEVTITDFDGDTDVATFSTGIDGTGLNDNDEVAGVGTV